MYKHNTDSRDTLLQSPSGRIRESFPEEVSMTLTMSQTMRSWLYGETVFLAEGACEGPIAEGSESEEMKAGNPAMEQGQVWAEMGLEKHAGARPGRDSVRHVKDFLVFIQMEGIWTS